MIVEGVPFSIRLISNPTVDDVLVAEARLELSRVEGYPVPDDHKVTRDIKDFLIRLGVER